ncbi:MAG: hypothetical protein GY700_01620 [Propionibacteriaceae bacterium]|nr:hypothetical protein [Propionibacteriaceae bacterium]
MKYSKATRITLIIVAGLVILGLAGFSVLSGTELDFEETIKIALTALASGAIGRLSKGGL